MHSPSSAPFPLLADRLYTSVKTEQHRVCGVTTPRSLCPPLFVEVEGLLVVLSLCSFYRKTGRPLHRQSDENALPDTACRILEYPSATGQGKQPRRRGGGGSEQLSPAYAPPFNARRGVLSTCGALAREPLCGDASRDGNPPTAAGFRHEHRARGARRRLE